jgi:hypothetical protein
LKQYADLWFDTKHAEFEFKDGNKIVGVWFHIDTVDSTLHYVNLRKSVVQILKDHFRLNEDHIRELQPVLDIPAEDYAALQFKILDLAEKLRVDKTIKYKQLYVVKALLNYAKPR